MKSKNNKVDNAVMSTVIRPIGEDDIDKKSSLDPEFTKDKKDKKDPKEGPEIPPVGFFSLFRYATTLDKVLITLGLLCSVATGLGQPLNTLIFGTLTGEIIEHASKMEYGNLSTPEYNHEADLLIESITNYALYNTLLGIGMMVFSYLSIILFNFSSLRQIFYIRRKFFSCMMNQDISWYDKNTTGDFANRMSEDLIKLEDGIGEKVSMFAHYQVAFVGSLILAFVKGWLLALICLTSLPVTMIAMGIVSRVTSRLARKEVQAYGVAGAIAEEVLSSIRTVVAFGGQKKEIDRYNDKLIYARDINIKRNLFSGIGFGLLWFCIYASYALAFWYGVTLILQDRSKDSKDIIYDPGTMVTVFFGVMMGSMNFGMSSPYIETFGVATGAGSKIFNVISNIPIINAWKTKGNKPDTIKGKITFKDVHFHYPSRPDVPILKGFDLTINPGETVALVGSSGCGKSTCIQLIQRFYDPIQGKLYLDENNIDDLNLNWLRNNIGVVGQEPVLFGTTIEDNIRYGYLAATQEEIEKAAKKANAHDFIMNLPLGYKTLVGERGAQLSGGQKQRIAIARALVRDPAILLLDEATSALDTNSEAKVQAALDDASKERTTVIVAHRLSTIRNADKIVVVHEGKVIEQGKHEELMLLKGAYHKLVTTQVAAGDDVEKSERSTEADEDMIPTRVRTMSATSEVSNARSSIKATDYEDVADDQIKPIPQTSLWEIMKFSTPEWPQISMGCFTSLIMGASMPVFAVLFGDILGILVNPDDQYVRQETDTYSLYFLIAGLITGFAVFFQMWCFGIAGERLTMRLRGKMFEAMLKQEMSWFDDKENGTGSLCSRLSTEAANVQGATGQRIGTILQSVSTLGLAVGLSMFYEYKLGLVATAFTPLILIATFLHGRLIKQSNFKHRDKIEQANKLAVEAVSNIRTVASLGCEDQFLTIYVDELVPGFTLAKRNVHYRGFVFGLARGLMFIAYAVCMYYGGYLIRYEGLQYAVVFKVSQALIMGTASIANALAFAPNFQKGLESAAKIFELLSRRPVVDDSLTAHSNDWTHGNISYDKVHFCYPTRPGIPVLRGLELAINQGKTVALVGPSGCGKSTIIQLLERFYDPNLGSVNIDHENIKQIKLLKLRSQMGIVSQEPSLFDRTIAENIAYGDNLRDVTRAEIIAAAQKANIHNFIVSLPTGYDTRLGDKGAQLSGGQKQRVAIARALVRDPKILLLDEATSALDTESEKVVQDALDKAKEGRTCITIAHRLSTIQDADVICVVNRGRIAEMGTHSQLLSKRGLYYNLHNLQNI